jgi:hypothetical protein
MNERDLALSFSRDVDDLPNEAGRTDLPTEYRESLELARTLAATDWSGQSQVRESLRRQWLNQVDAREGWRRRKEIPMRAFFWQRHPALSLAMVVLLALVAVTLAWPGTLTVADQGIRDFVQSLSLGQYTTIHQVNPSQAAPTTTRMPPPATPIVEQRDDLWIVHTAIGNFAGNILPGHDATVRRMWVLDEVQAATPFSLLQPRYLPLGYAFQEAMVTPLDWVLIFYDGPNGDIILAQMPVGERPGGDAEHVTSARTGLLTDKPIKSVTLNGQPAGWVEGYGLMWEANGVSYTVGGAKLTLDEATRIAESLK